MRINSPTGVLAVIIGMLSISAIIVKMSPAGFRDCGEIGDKEIKCKIKGCKNGICTIGLFIKGDQYDAIEIDCKNKEWKMIEERNFATIRKGSYIEREHGIACNSLPSLNEIKAAKDAYKDAFEKFQAGDYVDAIAAYDTAIQNRPKDAILYNSRGAAKRRSGDGQGAIDDYSKAIEIDPQYEEAFINRGMAKSYLEDTKGAALDFSRAIQINPKNAVAYYNRGVVRHDIKDEKGAISDWSIAIDIDPEYADAYLNRGITKETIGDLKGACADWQKAVDLGLSQPKRWIEKQCKDIAVGSAQSNLTPQGRRFSELAGQGGEPN